MIFKVITFTFLRLKMILIINRCPLNINRYFSFPIVYFKLINFYLLILKQVPFSLMILWISCFIMCKFKWDDQKFAISKTYHFSSYSADSSNSINCCESFYSLAKFVYSSVGSTLRRFKPQTSNTQIKSFENIIQFVFISTTWNRWNVNLRRFNTHKYI